MQTGVAVAISPRQWQFATGIIATLGRGNGANRAIFARASGAAVAGTACANRIRLPARLSQRET